MKESTKLKLIAVLIIIFASIIYWQEKQDDIIQSNKYTVCEKLGDFTIMVVESRLKGTSIDIMLKVLDVVKDSEMYDIYKATVYSIYEHPIDEISNIDMSSLKFYHYTECLKVYDEK